MNIGIDIGYYATKAVVNDRQVVFPSFAAPFTASRVSLNHRDAIAIESESGHFLVGDQALRLGQGARQESAQWLGSPEWLSLFYASLSELTTATNFAARVVIGLPLADYDRDKRAIAEIVRGRHSFKRNGRRAQSFDVSDLRCIPQAWGAVLDELLSENGKVRNEAIADQRVAVLDIGGTRSIISPSMVWLTSRQSRAVPIAARGQSFARSGISWIGSIPIYPGIMITRSCALPLIGAFLMARTRSISPLSSIRSSTTSATRSSAPPASIGARGPARIGKFSSSAAGRTCGAITSIRHSPTRASWTSR